MLKWIVGYVLFLVLWIYAITNTIRLLNWSSDAACFVGFLILCLLSWLLYESIQFIITRLKNVYLKNQKKRKISTK
jgi:hypothetical protein